MPNSRSFDRFEMPRDNERLLGRPLPIVALNTESADDPLQPGDFAVDGVDIYTNTLCHGAGTEGDDRLCGYCFLSAAQLKSKNMMGQDHVDSILDWATQPNSPIETASLLGGEFPLHPDAKEMVHQVDDAGLNVRIVTNGSWAFRKLLQNDDVVEVLKADNRDNLVAVSLDSLQPEINDRYRGKGATENALATIAMLGEKQIPFRVNATVMKAAIDGLWDLYGFARQEGAQAVLVHFPSMVGRGRRWDRLPNMRTHKQIEIPTSGATFDEPHEWEDSVRWSAKVYNAKRIPEDSSFRVTCEDGYGKVQNCRLLERSGSLQFLPPNPQTGEMPVVACGLNMATAATESAYLFRDGSLFTRAGITELSRARARGTTYDHRCPLRPRTSLACIYDRLEPKNQSTP